MESCLKPAETQFGGAGGRRATPTGPALGLERPQTSGMGPGGLPVSGQKPPGGILKVS